MSTHRTAKQPSLVNLGFDGIKKDGRLRGMPWATWLLAETSSNYRRFLVIFKAENVPPILTWSFTVFSYIARILLDPMTPHYHPSATILQVLAS